MARMIPVFLALAALIVLGVILFGSGDEDPGYIPDVTPLDPEHEVDPELLTSEAAKRKRAADEAAAREAAARAKRATHPTQKVLFLAGRVLANEGGMPIAGAAVTAHAGATKDEDRESEIWAAEQALGIAGAGARMILNQSTPIPARSLTQSDGTFRWMVDPKGITNPSRCDVFAAAQGYVPARIKLPPAGVDALFRLQKAIPLEVRVMDRIGRNIEGATVSVRPDPEAKQVLGHLGAAASDEEGRAKIDGLAPGNVLLTVDHPEFMPSRLPAFDPSREPLKEVRLRPALRMSFRIRSDDASPVVGPLLSWATDGAVPEKGLLLLKLKPQQEDGATNIEIVTEPVRIPCTHRNVTLEVKAEGFAAWKQVEPLPADGGEREVLAQLTRDTALASLEVSFEDPDGNPVTYRDLGPTPPGITNLDGKDIGSIRVEMGESLVFGSLPPGTYRIEKACPSWAPASIDVEVKPGEPNNATVKLRKPAKVRIRFTSSERRMVRFRMLRGEVILPAFPENAGAGSGTPGLGKNPGMQSGEEGAVFSGLSSGPCTIEVISPELVPVTRTVRLQEGETVEVEIEVEAR